jgi:hypothetical protein
MTRIPFFSFFFVDGVTFRLCWGKPVCTEIGPYVVGLFFNNQSAKALFFFKKSNLLAPTRRKEEKKKST